MKYYKYSRAVPVNENFGKDGYRWEYGGKLNEEQAEGLKEFRIDDNEHTKFTCTFGIRIKDAETNEVVYEYLNMNWLNNHKEQVKY